MGGPSVDVVSVVRPELLPPSPKIATRTTTTAIAIARADPIQPSTIPATAMPRPPRVPSDFAIRRLATYPKTNASPDPIQDTKKAKTAIVNDTIPRTIDAIARPLFLPTGPYIGGGLCNPAAGGSEPNGGAVGGGP